ncbi:MAG TPA: Crp/Fnr family transcriptional regulator [Nocardioidaceae bacterium]|nr:Crp/Fnr family transcriptional regulator [Nocardioidaceae bacterium]
MVRAVSSPAPAPVRGIRTPPATAAASRPRQSAAHPRSPPDLLWLTDGVWPLLRPLSVPDREAFLALTRPRTFARNEVVCHAGDPADALHLVESGHLAVRSGLSTGVMATFTILSRGQFFGELALLREDRRRTATVVALEASRTLSVAGSAFQSLCLEHPHVERALTAMLADRVDALSQRLLETMYESLDRRVYSRLVELADSYGPQERAATIPLSQTQLADLVGATRPSVNQVLQRLADQGLVQLSRGRIEVLDVVALKRRCR